MASRRNRKSADELCNDGVVGAPVLSAGVKRKLITLQADCKKGLREATAMHEELGDIKEVVALRNSYECLCKLTDLMLN